MTEPLLEFMEQKSCPKCEGTSFMREYRAALYAQGESLLVTCRGCGFIWSEQTADAKARRLQQEQAKATAQMLREFAHRFGP